MRIELGGLVLEAVSVAGHETCIQVPSWDLAFDIGRCPRSAVHRSRVFFTHGHIDHVGGVAHHVATREMIGVKPPKYFVPRTNLEAFEDLLGAFRRLNRSELPCEVQAVEPGDVIQLGPNKRVEVFRAVHRVPTLGYALVGTRKRLRPELRGLSGPEIGAARARGEAIEEAYEVVELVFCGDTVVQVLDHPLVRSAQRLVLECTFVDDKVDIQRAIETGHVHLRQLADNPAALPQPHILLTHFSARYSGSYVKDQIKTRLPEDLWSRVTALV